MPTHFAYVPALLNVACLVDCRCGIASKKVYEIDPRIYSCRLAVKHEDCHIPVGQWPKPLLTTTLGVGNAGCWDAPWILDKQTKSVRIRVRGCQNYKAESVLYVAPTTRSLL